MARRVPGSLAITIHHLDHRNPKALDNVAPALLDEDLAPQGMDLSHDHEPNHLDSMGRWMAHQRWVFEQRAPAGRTA